MKIQLRLVEELVDVDKQFRYNLLYRFYRRLNLSIRKYRWNFGLRRKTISDVSHIPVDNKRFDLQLLQLAVLIVDLFSLKTLFGH